MKEKKIIVNNGNQDNYNFPDGNFDIRYNFVKKCYFVQATTGEEVLASPLPY